MFVHTSINKYELVKSSINIFIVEKYVLVCANFVKIFYLILSRSKTDTSYFIIWHLIMSKSPIRKFYNYTCTNDFYTSTSKSLYVS